MRHERAHLPAISAPRAVVGAKATGSRARAPEILGARVPPGQFRKARFPAVKAKRQQQLADQLAAAYDEQLLR